MGRGPMSETSIYGPRTLRPGSGRNSPAEASAGADFGVGQRSTAGSRADRIRDAEKRERPGLRTNDAVPLIYANALSPCSAAFVAPTHVVYPVRRIVPKQGTAVSDVRHISGGHARRPPRGRVKPGLDKGSAPPACAPPAKKMCPCYPNGCSMDGLGVVNISAPSLVT